MLLCHLSWDSRQDIPLIINRFVQELAWWNVEMFEHHIKQDATRLSVFPTSYKFSFHVNITATDITCCERIPPPPPTPLFLTVQYLHSRKRPKYLISIKVYRPKKPKKGKAARQYCFIVIMKNPCFLNPRRSNFFRWFRTRIITLLQWMENTKKLIFKTACTLRVRQANI